MDNMKKTLIAIPCMNTMLTPFVASLTHMRRAGATKVTFLSNSMVYDARNMLAAEAIDTKADRVLWIDSDMQFGADLMERLAEHIDSGLDYITGLYFKRVMPLAPLLAKKFVENDDGTLCGEVYLDYPRDELFEIAASGFGIVMTTTKLLKDVIDAFGTAFGPMPNQLGEDFAFCWRAKQLGYKLYCDSRIKADHMGYFPYNEKCYLAQKNN